MPTADDETRLETFTSKRYGYLIGYPAGWSVRRAERSLHVNEVPLGIDPQPAIDSFTGDRGELFVASQRLSQGRTLQNWTPTIVRGLAAASGPAEGCESPDARETLDVGGERARLLIYPECHAKGIFWTVIIHGNRGFHIVWFSKQETAADRALFERILATFAFTR
jgi:hypothetical protein